jgi:hypothetical protein
VDPVILHSARKHGVHDDTCSTPIGTPIRIFELDDTMLIGPDTATRFLEIGVANADGIECIVHAMPARDKFLR